MILRVDISCCHGCDETVRCLFPPLPMRLGAYVGPPFILLRGIDTMVDNEVHEVGDVFTDDFTDGMEFGTIWALLWLIMEAERQAVALALIGDESNDAVGAELLKKWAEPHLDAFRRDEDVPIIPWRRVAKILRSHLPYAKG
jgi:hypothetical protein